jgi:hypothetical protein
MKKNLILLLLVACMLGGCGWFDRTFISNVKGHSKECIEGVSYLQFPSGVTVQYTSDGKIKTCN